MRVPAGWRLMSLSELAAYHNGRAFKPEDWSEHGRPIIRIAQINNPDASTDYYAGNDVDERHLIQDGDLLFSWSATLTAIKWNRGPGIVNQHIFKVEARQGVDRDFLLYTILNAIDDLTEHSHGTTMKHIKKGVLKIYQVPVPPLFEQRCIAKILSSVDESIAATKAVIEQTRIFKKAVLKCLLTKGTGHARVKNTGIGEIPEQWDVRRLGEICEKITSGSRGWAQYYADEGTLFVRSQNIRSGRLDMSDRQFVTIPAGAEGNRTYIKADDLLFTITGNGVGNVAKAPEGLGEAYVSQHIALVRLHDRRLADMLMAFFSPDGPGNTQIVKAQYGQSKPGLSLDNIKNLLVPIPPPLEVNRITEVILEIASAEKKASETLEVEMKLKSALMSDLLTGRKRVFADALSPAL